MPVGRRVAIVGGDLVAIELAEFLAERGRRVAVFEPGETVAPEIGWKRKGEHLLRLDRLGVTLHTEVTVDEVVPDGPGLHAASTGAPRPRGRHRRPGRQPSRPTSRCTTRSSPGCPASRSSRSATAPASA